jgi:hypothetical protein
MGPAYWILTTTVFVSMSVLVLALNYFAHKVLEVNNFGLHKYFESTNLLTAPVFVCAAFLLNVTVYC